MELIEIKINDKIVHVIYLHEGVKHMMSFIAETPEKVVEEINYIINSTKQYKFYKSKNPTE